VVDPHLALSFALASVVFVAIPGPSVLFVISRGVSLGRRAAVLTVLGNAAGVYVQVIAVAAGIGPVIERSVLAYHGLKLLGAAYLVWLGVDAIRHRRSLTEALGHSVAVKAPRTILREGFVVGITNPKGIVFWTAILPQFIDPDRAAAPVQMLVLGLISVTIAVVSDSTYGVLAGTARQWFSRSPRRLEALGGAGGAVMIGLGVSLAASGRND
jgi:threonine/homoserine/homoserine lactone efflux protein